MLLTREYLKLILQYNEITGDFTWLKKGRGISYGKIAGSVDKGTGYKYIRINGKNWAAHRLAWLYIYGVWPKNQIDHINQNRLDNRVENLRDVTIRENAHNRVYYNNRDNLIGAYFNKCKNKWESSITIDNKKHYIGSYNNKISANEAYLSTLWMITEVQKL